MLRPPKWRECCQPPSAPLSARPAARREARSTPAPRRRGRPSVSRSACRRPGRSAGTPGGSSCRRRGWCSCARRRRRGVICQSTPPSRIIFSNASRWSAGMPGSSAPSRAITLPLICPASLRRGDLQAAVEADRRLDVRAGQRQLERHGAAEAEADRGGAAGVDLLAGGERRQRLAGAVAHLGRRRRAAAPAAASPARGPRSPCASPCRSQASAA